MATTVACHRWGVRMLMGEVVCSRGATTALGRMLALGAVLAFGGFLAASGMLTLGTCNKEPTPASPTMLQARPQPYVPDVPVPTGFEREERKSNYTSTAGHRQVKDYYRGKEQPLVARNFYLQYMPGAGWELLDEKLQNSVYVLNFRKDMERCEIRVERVPSGSLGTVTQVRVIIKPEQ